jgi:hypothetical protein
MSSLLYRSPGDCAIKSNGRILKREIFFNEIKNTPGFSKANITGYGVASDLQSRPKSRSQGVILSSPSRRK